MFEHDQHSLSVEYREKGHKDASTAASAVQPV